MYKAIGRCIDAGAFLVLKVSMSKSLSHFKCTPKKKDLFKRDWIMCPNFVAILGSIVNIIGRGDPYDH